MYIIEISALDNGAHRNQEYHGVIPPHWGDTAFIREDVSTLKNFPFGEVVAEEIDGVMTVTEWTPGTIPVPEPEMPIKKEPTELEQLRADIDYLLMLEEG